MKIKLKILTDDDSQKSWITTEDYLRSDWPLRFIIKVLYTDYYDEAWAKKDGRYHFEIYAVSPEAAGWENRRKAFESWGLEPTEHADNMEFQCQVLCDYGISACLWQETTNNKTLGLARAKRELETMQFLFGFFMDQPLNRIGSTGWDFIKGDILAGLNKTPTNP